jgi:hypothetical protein
MGTIEDCKRHLKALDEKTLRETIIIPLFEAKGREFKLGSADIARYIDYEAAKAHGPKEPQHKCDILLIRHERGSTSFEGIQAKKGDIAGDTEVQEIATDAGIAFRCPYKGSDGRIHSLDRYYWVTSGDLKVNGRTSICTFLDHPASPTFGRVVVWDCLQLIDEVQQWAPHLLPPLELLILQSSKDDYNKAGQNAYASWYAYQSFRWFLRNNPSEILCAREHLVEAQRLLAEDPRARLFFSRTLARFYQMWIDLIDASPELLVSGTFDPITDIENEQVRGVLQGKYPGRMYWLLSDISFVMQQLEILAAQYVNTPAGLSTLQICQLLLRTTYPPELEGIAARIGRLLEDLKEEDGNSIDGECSLCTGTAVSCLALSGQKTLAQRAFVWLTGLKGARYSYHPRSYVDAPAEEHALHYAASVLESALDFEYPGCEELKVIVRVFFDRVVPVGKELSEWMRYRNIDRFEVYSYILPAMLRYLLCGFPLEHQDRKVVKFSIKRLLKELRGESKATETPVWRPYAGRQNLGAMSLGCLLGIAECRYLASKIAGVFHHRAREVGSQSRSKPHKKELWDSNVDRTAAFIDGYFLYWETLLELESCGEPIEDLLPDPA